MSFIEIKNKKNAIEIHNQLVELKRNKNIKIKPVVECDNGFLYNENPS